MYIYIYLYIAYIIGPRQLCFNEYFLIVNVEFF